MTITVAKNQWVKFFYNPEVIEAGYTHQTVKAYKPGSTIYEREMHYAFSFHKAGDVIHDPFNRVPDFPVNDLDDFLTYCDGHGASGIFRFIDQDRILYEIHQTGAFEYGVLEEDGQRGCDGINWATAWFFTEAAALKFGQECGHRHDEPRYHEDLGTWSVHYHQFD